MDNLDSVIENIEYARLSLSAHHIVQIVAVSKYSDSQAVESLYNLGQRAFGENKVQDLESKMQTLEALPLEWHFMGNLQTNKINKLIDLSPDLVQSISSLSLAKEIEKRLATKEANFNALLQINSANEESKGGVSADEAIDIYQEIKETCPHIQLQGVMSIGAHSEDKSLIEKSFKTTHTLYESLQKEGATICSMGMSSDYELAIRMGSNMVRLGSVLFK
jgi:pyridoxal phosphate enzyme (YggS family)